MIYISLDKQRNLWRNRMHAIPAKKMYDATENVRVKPVKNVYFHKPDFSLRSVRIKAHHGIFQNVSHFVDFEYIAHFHLRTR